MNKIAEPAVQLLFLMLSVTAAVLPSGSYIAPEAWESLYFTNIINAAITGGYLLIRVLMIKRTSLEYLQRGMLLLIMYSCLPVFALINSFLTKILSVICFAGALGVFIIKNLHNDKTSGLQEFNKRGRMFFSFLMLFFAAGFLFRGVNVIFLYSSGASGITDMLVSISDIIICVIWFMAGIGFLRKTTFGEMNILPCYIQASLLFIGLIIFLLVNPLIIGSSLDAEAVTVITVMGMFFFIPTVLLLKKIRKPQTQ